MANSTTTVQSPAQQGGIYGRPLTQFVVDLNWNIYTNLENEVVSLTRYIQFDDANKRTYSIYMAEIILRISAEIESLCKDLYATLGCVHSGSRFNFDDPCIKEFVRRWNIDKKAVDIIHPSIIFSNREIFPFANATQRTTTPGANVWKSAYNDIKHNLRSKMASANIGVLVEELAALFLLNVYSRGLVNATINISDRHGAEGFDATFGSSVFAVKVSKLLDAKSVSADGVKMLDSRYCPECTFYITPEIRSLFGIVDMMKKVRDEARSKDHIADVMRTLIKEKKINLPAEGQLPQAFISNLSLQLEIAAWKKHPGEFSRAVAGVQYIARLDSPKLHSATVRNITSIPEEET